MSNAFHFLTCKNVEDIWHLLFEEECLKVNWNKNQDSSMAEHQTRDLEVQVQIPVEVRIFLLKLNLIVLVKKKSINKNIIKCHNSTS